MVKVVKPRRASTVPRFTPSQQTAEEEHTRSEEELQDGKTALPVTRQFNRYRTFICRLKI